MSVGDVAMTVTGRVEIVPGVIGPTKIKITDNRFAMGPFEGGIRVHLIVGFDRSTWRYVCQELRAVRDAGPVTTEALQHVKIADWIAATLHGPESVIHVLPNPKGVEPWGLSPPAGGHQGPTDRALRWVAHLYRYAQAVYLGPTQHVQGNLELARSTADRWVSLAREAGYLEPAGKS